MKKVVFLYSFTAVAIGAILLTGNAIIHSVVPVTSVKLIPSTAENYVVCSGKVESAEETNVYPDYSGIAQQVFVSVGDKVAKDQPIMQIKRMTESTGSCSSVSSSAADTNYAQYSQYLSGLSSSQINDIANVLSAAADSASSSSLSSSSAPSEEETVGKTTYFLTAPAAGVIKSLAASKSGDYVIYGNPAAVIMESIGLRVRLSVDESQVSDLKKGQKVQITGVGFSHSVYWGNIVSIASKAKQLISTTGQETVVEALASVNHPGNDILPGFNAKVKITTSEDNRALVVPYEAVREDTDGKEYVYLVSGGRAKRRDIITGKELDNGFEVKSGLRADELVITDPDDVHDNVKVVQTVAGKSESVE